MRNKNATKILIAVAAMLAMLLAAGCGGVSKDTASTPGAKPTPTPAPGAPTPTPTPGTGAVPHSAHVVLVIEENHTFAQVQSSMPWLVAQGNTYAYAIDYHADEPGSLLDYLWLSSGSGEKA